MVYYCETEKCPKLGGSLPLSKKNQSYNLASLFLQQSAIWRFLTFFVPKRTAFLGKQKSRKIEKFRFPSSLVEFELQKNYIKRAAPPSRFAVCAVGDVFPFSNNELKAIEHQTIQITKNNCKLSFNYLIIFNCTISDSCSGRRRRH
jgi:hypothetical protein